MVLSNQNSPRKQQNFQSTPNQTELNEEQLGQNITNSKLDDRISLQSQSGFRISTLNNFSEVKWFEIESSGVSWREGSELLQVKEMRKRGTLLPFSPSDSERSHILLSV